MKFLALLLVFVIYQPQSNAQTIEIIPSIGYLSHSANLDLDESFTTPEIPSLGVFYSSAAVFGLRSLYAFNDIRVDNSTFFTGLLYEHSEMKAKTKGIILGNDFVTNTVGFSIGYKRSAEEQFPKIFLSISLEYLMSFNYGYTDFGAGVNSISKYNTQSTFRLRVGIEYFNPESIPFIIGFSVNVGYGTIKRDKIDFYENDIFQDSLYPSGDLVLPDLTLGLSIDFSYPISL